MLVNAALTTRWRGNHRHLAAPWRTGRRPASVLPGQSDCGRGMSEEVGRAIGRTRPVTRLGALGARGPLREIGSADQNRPAMLGNAANHGLRRVSTLVAPTSDRLSRYPPRATRCAGWYQHGLRHHHVLGRDRDPRPVHAVTTATGEVAGCGRDVHPVTETTGRRSCGASGDTGLPAAGSPAVGVLTRCTLAGRGLGSGQPPPPRTASAGRRRGPARRRTISRLR